MSRTSLSRFPVSPFPLFVLLFLLVAHAVALAGEAGRVVVIKVDGLPQGLVERYVHEREPRTGKSLLPWIDYVFYQRGTRLANFYVRGMSLSGPSWSLLDTGQHLQIKGNVEFDRFTLHSYDYLNFIPFWVENVAQKRVDMPGAEVLDELGLPLLFDAYPYDQRYLSFQLYQRGTRWTTLQRGLQNRFTSRSPRELFDEWNTGFDARSIVMEQLEREVIEKLKDPRVRYLDLYTTEVDHATHHNRDRASHLAALQDLDSIVGRIWMAIQQTPQASQTALVLVSDHGTNSDERVYSQGYNLVKLLASAQGGGHHVVTKRRLMNDYALKGFYPLVPLIYTTTPDSFYLHGQSNDYPTALVDFDGNERASIHLRNSDLNVLHILLLQLARKDLAPAVRRAATETFFATVERHRGEWQKRIAEMNEELGALHHLIEKQSALVEAQPKKFTQAERDAGRDKEKTRLFAHLDSWMSDERDYTEYLRTLANLLALKRESFDPSRLRLPELIAKGSMGEQNTIHELQNYVVGPSAYGLTLAPDGSLDFDKSFRRVDYFALLDGASVRNNVQTGIASRPVDFVATRIPLNSILPMLDAGTNADEVIWLAGRDTQSLVLARNDEAGRLLLRYLPVAGLAQDAQGRVSFRRAEWRAGLPLQIFEDANLQLPANVSRADWLDAWHTDTEWLRAIHRTAYSNGFVGIYEQLGRHPLPIFETRDAGLSDDERLIRRFRQRQRQMVETDLLILANNHWNFDVRGFNPGGNHGSFFRVSTHSALMFAGGERTGIPRGLEVTEPYDSLSYAPTVLALTGQLDAGQKPVPVLWRQGFRTFPGRIIKEIFETNHETAPPIADAAKTGAAH